MCNDDTAVRRGQPGYDPTYKYDYIFKTIVHNINHISEKAELDATIGKAYFTTASPGEKDTGVTYQVRGKSEVSKGGQTFLICDSHCI